MKKILVSKILLTIGAGAMVLGFAMSSNAAPKRKTASAPNPTKTADVKKPKAEPKDRVKKTTLEELKWVEGDERGNEVKALKAELMVSHVEEKAIKQAQLLIKKHKGTSLEPGLQFRLAEMYMRKSKTERFFEIHRLSPTVVKLAPQLVTSASSKAAVQEAIKTYTLLEKQYPNFGQMDLVIFNHAFASQAIGEDKEAEALYWKLVKNFGGSPLVPEAHLAIGEIAFGRGQFPHALDHFNAVKKFPNSRVYPYGLYKAAWTYYNMRDAQAAMKKLEEVVAYGRMVTKNKIVARLDLRKEALLDMTIFYEDVYESKDAFKYFRAQAGELDVSPSILRLSEIYERHSRFNDQREVLTQFIQVMPESEGLPDVYDRLVVAHDHLRQMDQSVVRMNSFYSICQPGSRWLKAVAKTEEETSAKSSQCSATLNETALTLAKKWLKSWKKTPKEESYANASEKAFEIYLRAPKQTEEYGQARYAYAELLFQRGKYRQASTEYASISNSSSIKSGSSGTLGHDAAYAAVVSLEKAVGEKWSNDDEKTFHQLAQNYVSKNPKGQYRLDLEFKMALLAYEKSRYDEAAPMFLRLGKDFAGQEKGQRSQDLYLDILNIKKDYQGVRDYTSQLIKSNPDVARADKLQKLYEGAYFLQIQNLEEKNQPRLAMAEYLKFAQQNPSSPLAEKALWNGMQLQFKVGEDFEAAKSCEEFAQKYPKSDQSINALLRAAQTYETMGQLGPAARVLSRLSEVDEKAKSKWKEVAADFYTLDGQFVVARKMYNDLKMGASGARLVSLVTKLEALEKNYGTEQTHNESMRALVELGVKPQAGEAKALKAEKLFEGGNLTEAFAEARQLLGSSLLTSSQKARMRFVQAQILEQEFIKQSVKSRVDRITTVLAIKTEKLQKAQEAFQSAIKYGDAKVTVQAMEKLYGCYSHYVTALKEMPTPVGLSGPDVEAFRSEIDKLIVPLEEKSVDTLSGAVTFAKKQQFIDGTVARLEAALNKVNMQTTANVASDLRMPAAVLPLIAEVGP